jgi:hypothetical protein
MGLLHGVVQVSLSPDRAADPTPAEFEQNHFINPVVMA